MPEPNAADNPPAPPAYFLSLTVENFRCFKQSVRLDLSDGNGKPSMWNVLLGENGVGKTTLLQCLASMEAREMVNHKGIFEPKVLWDVNSPVMLAFFDDSAAAAIHTSIDVEEVQYTIGLVKHATDTPGTHRVTPKWAEGNLSQHKCDGFGATRRMSAGYLYETLSAEPCASLFNDSVKLINAEEWLIQANYAAQVATGEAKKRAEKRLAQVIDLLCGILPEGGVTDIRFTLDESTAVMTPRVEAQTPFGWVRLRDLSLGYQAALTWMVDLAARMLERYPGSANPLAEPAIVLVDEIDLHLHPKWQRELIAKLRRTFPKTQFIVTAHSPLIVQAAPDANLALLKRVGDHVEIVNDVEYVRNWRVDQILTSDVFGLESARPPALDAALREREALLTKPTLTKADWKRLDVLNREITETPDGEKTDDLSAQTLLRRAEQLLKGK